MAIYEFFQKSADENHEESNPVPWTVVELPDHHDSDQALKSAKMTAKAGWKIWTS